MHTFQKYLQYQVPYGFFKDQQCQFSFPVLSSSILPSHHYPIQPLLLHDSLFQLCYLSQVPENHLPQPFTRFCQYSNLSTHLKSQSQNSRMKDRACNVFLNWSYVIYNDCTYPYPFICRFHSLLISHQLTSTPLPRCAPSLCIHQLVDSKAISTSQQLQTVTDTDEQVYPQWV